MMRIQIIPKDYSNSKELTSTIKSVIKQHPLRNSVTSAVQERLLNMPIVVEISNYLVNICLGVRLHFDPMMYQDKGKREKVLFHEFAHIIDRLNPDFGIDCQSEDEARIMQPKQMTEGGFMVYQSIWNCYIDGRLEQSGQNPRSFKQHLQEFHDCSKHFGGYFTKEVNAIFEKAWNSKNLSFNEIVNLVKNCLQYWQPEKPKET